MLPLASLPADILCIVFRLLINLEGCMRCASPDYENNTLPKYPMLLSHVCSYWQRVAIESRALWSHIDLPLRPTNRQALCRRAEAFLGRAGGSALEIHIVDLIEQMSIPLSGSDGTGTTSDIVDLLIHPVARTRSLAPNLRFEDRSEPHGQLLKQVSYIVARLTRSARFVPGARLDVRGWDNGHSPDNSSQLIESPIEDQEDVLGVQRLDDFLRPVSVLKLWNLRPRWSSKAYHRLVELWIGSTTIDIILTQPQAILVLESSPKIRILGFYKVVMQAGGGVYTPVCLNDLEVLVVSVKQRSLLLDLIAPGKKGLYLSLPYYGFTNEDPFTHILPSAAIPAGIETFLLRSNITVFHLHDPELIRSKICLGFLRLMPTLQTLVLDSLWEFKDIAGQDAGPTKIPHLQNVYVSNACRVPLSNLRETLFMQCRVQKITLSNRRFRRRGAGFETLKESELMARLAGTGVAVEIHPLPPRLIPRFGSWDNYE